MTPVWLADLEPLTTGLLGQEGLKLWHQRPSALGIRSGGVVYPVFPEDPGAAVEARELLGRLPELWCLMGPADWVERGEALVPPSSILRRIGYHFLSRPAAPAPGDDSGIRRAQTSEAEALFALQEGYEKEEVLFDPSEFQPVVSRLHFAKTLRHQLVLALWDADRPVAKAGTNAQTERWAQIGGVYTRPDRRGQGLQKRLMAALVHRLWTEGRGACLFVKKSNAAATGLYRALGFQDAGDFTITYGQRRSWVPGFR